MELVGISHIFALIYDHVSQLKTTDNQLLRQWHYLQHQVPIQCQQHIFNTFYRATQLWLARSWES